MQIGPVHVDAELIAQILNIVVIDLVLSGDNAVVIGMAASRLDGRDRRQAIMWGVIGAIALRVIFTAMAALLLDIPLLQLVGGVMLVYIAIKLVRPAAHDQEAIKPASTRIDAIRTIVMADVVMSLDNILAVGGAAEGSVPLLLFGLALSMPLITFGSGFVAWLLDRLPILIYVGAGVLAKVAADMIAEDPYTHSLMVMVPKLWLEVAFVLGVIAVGIIWRMLIKGEPTLAEQAHEVAEELREADEAITEEARRGG